MPRNYLPKNPYCRGSKLPVDTFVDIVRCYISGLPAIEAAVELRKLGEPVSERTVRRYYRLVGEYIYLRIRDTVLAVIVDDFEAVRASKSRAEYDAFAAMVFERIFDQSHKPDPVTFDILYKLSVLPDDALNLLRFLSAKKRGITHSKKEHVALIILRGMAQAEILRNRGKPAPNEIARYTADMLLNVMLMKPLDMMPAWYAGESPFEKRAPDEFAERTAGTVEKLRAKARQLIGRKDVRDALAVFGLKELPATTKQLDDAYWEARQNTPQDLLNGLARRYQLVRYAMMETPEKTEHAETPEKPGSLQQPKGQYPSYRGPSVPVKPPKGPVYGA